MEYLSVPACSLHVQPVHIRPLTRRRAEVFAVLLGNVTLQTHSVQRPLVPVIIHTNTSHQVVSIMTYHLCVSIPPSHGLHDGCEEGLGIEEASQPNCRG